MTHDPMLTRRSLLLSSGALALGSLLSGCGPATGGVLRILLLSGSIPPQLPGEFERQQAGVSVDFVLRSQLTPLFEQLQRWGADQPPPAPAGLGGVPAATGNAPSASVSDLVTLGDFWLAAAIQQNLIQPLNLAELPGWAQLDTRWQNLVRRNQRGESVADGSIWAAPYRFGQVAIAYRKDLFDSLGWVPTDWADLWRPELSRKISLPDSPRTVIGIALKKLGQSANVTDLERVAGLNETLDALHRQVKFYSSDAYLQPLSLDDTWAAVGWSTDISTMAARDVRVAAVVPASGTLLFADLWVRPQKAAGDGAIARQWINFCWQPEVATRLSLLSNAASPILSGGPRPAPSLPPRLQSNSLLLPSPTLLDRSDFLLPLPAATLSQYQGLWTALRQQTER